MKTIELDSDFIFAGPLVEYRVSVSYDGRCKNPEIHQEFVSFVPVRVLVSQNGDVDIDYRYAEDY